MRNWISLIVGAAVILLAFAGWRMWRGSASSALEAARVQLGKLGFATTLAEIAADDGELGPPPAPEQNAAEIYQRAIERLTAIRDSDDDGPQLSNWPRSESGTLEIPRDVRRALPALDPVFALLREAAEKPRCRFALDWQRGFELESPHLGPLLALSHWLAAKAVVDSFDGHHDAAIAHVRLIFKTADALREEPLLVSQLVRAAMTTAACVGLREVLLRHPSPVDAFEAAKPHAAEGGVATALAVEALNILSLAESPEFQQVWLMGPYIDGSLARCASVMSRLAALAREPYIDVAARMRELEAEGLEAINSFTGVVRPFGERTLREVTRVASLVELTRLGARALDRRRRIGRYPRTLEALPNAPLDPLTGRPFVVTRREDGGLELSTAREDGTGWEKTLWVLPAELP